MVVVGFYKLFPESNNFFVFPTSIYSYNGPFLTLKTRQCVYYIIAIHTRRTSSPYMAHALDPFSRMLATIGRSHRLTIRLIGIAADVHGV